MAGRSPRTHRRLAASARRSSPPTGERRPRERARAPRPVLGAARRRRQLRHRHRVRVPRCTRSARPCSAGRCCSSAERGARGRCAPTATSWTAADDDLGGCAVLQLAPPAPFVPPDLVGRPVVGIMVAAFGGPRARRASSSRRCGRSGRSSTRSAPMPYTRAPAADRRRQPRAASRASSRPRSWTRCPTRRSTTALEPVAERIPSPFTEVLIQPLGGAYARVEPGRDRARAPRRAAGCTTRSSQWDGPGRHAAEPHVDRPTAWRRWRRTRAAATHPNHVSSDRQERVRSFYGDDDLRAARRGQGPLGPRQRVLPQPEHPALLNSGQRPLDGLGPVRSRP